ncbi:MAG: hypothetical protein Q9166_008219, partial [cf. Caloplaca sp. 2 TL-2023]
DDNEDDDNEDDDNEDDDNEDDDNEDDDNEDDDNEDDDNEDDDDFMKFNSKTDTDCEESRYEGFYDESRRMHKTFYLLKYASIFWAQHMMEKYEANVRAQAHYFLARNPRVLLVQSSEYDTYNYWGLTIKSCTGVGIAAYFGLCDHLEQLIEDSEDLDRSTYGGSSALVLAVDNNQAAAVKILLDHGASIDWKSSRAQTPLSLAIQHRFVDTALTLVERGANVNTRSWENKKPFQMVDWKSPRPFLEILLHAGARICTQDLFDDSLLMNSLTRNDDLATAQWLFEQCDPSESDKEEKNSRALLEAARIGGSTKFIEMLLDHGAKLDSADNIMKTSLHWSSERGHSNVVKLLLDCGSDAQAQDYYCETSLFKAAKNGREECLRLLLDYDGHINAQNKSGTTPLIAASAKGAAGCVLALLERGAEVDMRDDAGETALHKSAGRGDLKIVDELLRYQVNADSKTECINAQNKSGTTPLMAASKRGMAGCVLALLENGAEVDIQDNMGGTALHEAAARGDLKIVDELLRYRANADSKTERINAQNKSGITPLMAASEEGTAGFILALLERGAEVDIQDNAGRTALHKATARGDLKIVDELLRYRANADSKTQSTCITSPFRGDRLLDGKDVSELAMLDLEELSTLMFLLPVHGRLEVWERGMTALDIAMTRGNEDIADLLRPLTTPAKHVAVVPFDEYLCRLFGASTFKQAEIELYKRIRKLKERSKQACVQIRVKSASLQKVQQLLNYL